MMRKAQSSYSTIDEYLDLIPPAGREALEKLRRMIKSIIPDATEGISYRIPVIKYKGRPLVGFGMAADHCSFYVMSSTVIPRLKDRLKAYNTSTGTIRFPAGKPLSEVIVKNVVKLRIAENESTGKSGAAVKRKGGKSK